jgi:hypothetical protein
MTATAELQKADVAGKALCPRPAQIKALRKKLSSS